MNRVLNLTVTVLLVLLLMPQVAYVAEEEGPAKLSPPTQAQDLPAEDDESALVTIDFEQAEIRDVIRVIAMASGMNMVIGEDVQAKVTISLKDVHWERALDVILRTYNFTYKKEENLIRIMTFEKLKQEERDVPLDTEIIYLNFADVGSMQSTLAKSLSDRGSIEVDKRTSSLVVTDIPARVEEVKGIAETLDTRTPQVMIEVMLVDVKLTEYDDLGINWKIISTHGLGDREDIADYIEQPDAMSSIGGTAIKIGWTQRLGEYGIDGLIQAWVQDQKAKILASPKVLTLDNQQASIEIIDEIPYKASMSEQGNVSYAFKEVGTKLYVTPHITTEGFVSMNLKPELSSHTGNTDDGQPIIDTRKAETNVLIRDEETIVIGGLRRIDDTRTYTKIPFLGDIPFLGNLFRKKDTQKVDTELLMFVTPRIVVKPRLRLEEQEKYRWLDELSAQKKERFNLMDKIFGQEKKRKRAEQALLISPGIAEEVSLSEEEAIEITEEEVMQEEEDYIYSW